jgi:large subunit ribosomal protein L15
MDLSNLKPADGSVKKRKRIGRGQGSGRGGTSTRGHKGAKSRSGYKRKAGFEGGQMPLQRRLPKVGFNNVHRIAYVGINLDVLQSLATKHSITNFDKDALRKFGVVAKTDLVKILGRGKLTSAISISADAFSSTAKEAIEAAGGKATLNRPVTNEIASN